MKTLKNTCKNGVMFTVFSIICDCYMEYSAFSYWVLLHLSFMELPKLAKDTHTEKSYISSICSSSMQEKFIKINYTPTQYKNIPSFQTFPLLQLVCPFHPSLSSHKHYSNFPHFFTLSFHFLPGLLLVFSHLFSVVLTYIIIFHHLFSLDIRITCIMMDLV